MSICFKRIVLFAIAKDAINVHVNAGRYKIYLHKLVFMEYSEKKLPKSINERAMFNKS